MPVKQKIIAFIIFIILLIFGFAYRNLLSSYRLDKDKLVGDEYEFQLGAIQMISGVWGGADYVYYTKNLGYSAFLAGIYSVFGTGSGIGDYRIIRIIQICLDLVTTVLIYLTARNLFSRKTALWAFLIYLTYPINATFAQYRMAEILTSFIVTLIAFVMSVSAFKTNRALWMIWGLLLGLLIFVRYQFLYLNIFLVIFTGILLFKKMRRIFFIIIASLGLLISSSYTLAANYENYHVISLASPTGSKWGLGFMLMYYMNFRWPEMVDEGTIKNPQMDYLWQEFSATPLEGRPNYERKYKSIFFQKLRTDWPVFLKNYLSGIIWSWDKYHLSVFKDPYFPADKIPVRIYNLILLLMFAVGIIGFFIEKGITAWKNPVMFFTLLFFLYMTFVITLVDNETRHTLPFYSLLILWCANGADLVRKNINRFARNKTQMQ